MEDQLVWWPTKEGQLSVKSAYHLEKSRSSHINGETSSRVAKTIPWKAIWKSKVLGTMKNFVWKASCDIIPTKSNLVKKRVLESHCCPTCNSAIDNALHVLWLCPAAMQVWGNDGSPLVLLPSGQMMFEMYGNCGGRWWRDSHRNSWQHVLLS